MAAPVLAPPRRPPAPAVPPPGPPAPGPEDPGDHDLWPRTNRVLPWLVAIFLVVVLVTPFDSTELRVDLPIDVKLDRILIGLMGLVWLLSFLAGGPGAPLLRSSPLHALVAAFVVVALASLALNATQLVREDELTGGIKKLSVLVSWAALFGVVATSIRPAEIRPLVNLLLACATLTAVGVLFEYFTTRNLFFQWWSEIVPPAVFELRAEPTTRNMFVSQPITGPMQHALALAATMAMGIGFAISALLRSTSTRSRVGYVVIAAILLGAVFATNRKTGGFATLGVLVVLFALRPRQIGIYLPIAIVALGFAYAVRPGAVEAQLRQIDPAKITEGASAEGRIEDYRAITPDVRHRVLTGKGYGTYDPNKYRILDNQMLVLVLEIGLIGTAAFSLLLLSIPFVARGALSRAGPDASAAALAAGGAAGAMGVSAFLFDALAFPGPVYLLFLAAGLLVVAASTVPPQPRRAGGRFALPGRRGAGPAS